MIIILGTTRIGMIRIGTTRGTVDIIRFRGIVPGIITAGITDHITGTAVIIGDTGTDITTDIGMDIGIRHIGMIGDVAIMEHMVTEIR